MEFKKIENTAEYAEKLIKNGATVINAIKKDTARVLARRGVTGEVIVTYTANSDGSWAETQKVISALDMVLTTATTDGKPVVDENGRTNTYTNTAVFFAENYIPAEKEGLYRQKQSPRRFVKIEENISIVPSWGGEMNLTAGSYLNITNMDDIYGIAPDEFNMTHDIVG